MTRTGATSGIWCGAFAPGAMAANNRNTVMIETPARRLALPQEKLALSIKEAAQMSSLGETSIYKAIKDGQLISRKYGTRTIIRRVDLDSFLESLPQ